MSTRAARPRRGVSPSLPWDPLRELLSLKDSLNRLLESVQRRGDFSGEGVAGWSPPVDLREERGGFVLTSEVPGVRAEDLTIRVDGGTVTIEGRRMPEREVRSALRLERPHGFFTRSLQLPAPVDETKVSARLILGILQIVLPRSLHARSHSIKVQVRS